MNRDRGPLRRVAGFSESALPFLRRRSYDRSRSLSEASRARARGNPTKAIARYREVLEHEPTNTDIHRRLAPLLAGTRQVEDAWASYQIAIAHLVRGGFLDQAIGVLREAAGCLGKQRAVWEELANVETERGRPIDAHAALLEGRNRFRSRQDAPDAIHLLLRARKLAPGDFATNHDLAALLIRSGAPDPAAHILRQLALQSTRSQLRRVRGLQFRLAPSPGAFWAWIRASFGRR